MPFTQHRDSFSPEKLALMQLTFDEVWSEIESRAQTFDKALMRARIADLIVVHLSREDIDPADLQVLVLEQISRD